MWSRITWFYGFYRSLCKKFQNKTSFLFSVTPILKDPLFLENRKKVTSFYFYLFIFLAFLCQKLSHGILTNILWSRHFFFILLMGVGKLRALSKCQNQSPKAQAGPTVPHCLCQPCHPGLPFPCSSATGNGSYLAVGILGSFKALHKCYFFHEASLDSPVLLWGLSNITYPLSSIQ